MTATLTKQGEQGGGIEDTAAPTKWETFIARRRSLGVSQGAAAARLETSQTTVSAWETLVRPPDLLDVPAIADFLGLTVADTLFDLGRFFLSGDTRKTGTVPENRV